MKKHDFLLELYIEDLPAQELKSISKSFLKIFKKNIKKNKIQYDMIKSFATPRRLAITICSIHYIQKYKEIRKKGPLLDHSFTEKGNATPIALSWAQHCGINIKDAKSLTINKKKYLTCKTKYKKYFLIRTVKKIILYVLVHIPSKKTMHWNEEKFQFSRPIRNIIALLDDQIIPINIFNLSSNRFSRGHVFMNPQKIEINCAKQYRSKFFYQFYVMINYEKRKNFIKDEIIKLAKKLYSIPKIHKKQLNEVTSSVEWPVILYGNSIKNILIYQKKILIHTMEACQKYFPLYDVINKKILTKFIFISNIETKNPNNIIQGNESVLKSKLSNVIFFLKKDLNIPFFDRLLLLKNICFKKKLGSMYDKTNRIRLISIYIAKQINANVSDTERAALLSKCDLTTYMIIEYPELQGSIGMYYAIKNKEKKTVALAIKEQYLPNTSTANLPTQPISYALSIAEKIDTITGIFSLEKKLKNHNDPFALRRATIGIIRIIIEKELNINIVQLIKKSIHIYSHITNKKQIQKNVLKFILSKFKHFLEKKGCDKKIIQSVFALNTIDFIDIHSRILILEKLYKQKKIDPIIKTFKRVENILKNQPDYFTMYSDFPKIKNHNNLTSIEEILIKSLNNIYNDIKNKKKYSIIVSHIEKLVIIINSFFDTSFIYDKNKKKRKFRLSILGNIKIYFYISLIFIIYKILLKNLLIKIFMIQFIWIIFYTIYI
ncbi:glycyl-tRNA synthetase, beta subunit [Buchnera aphidicola (Cinara tujafilina)]|uniref:Glycine--tRNA ligase beta subunit n=1 Tax=Buchnera aphidicola (Cinara tujafilina) TaxID=261317 RepID=F7WZ28_9GAMM|nr:glycine--tRNA ligase subunit beta [Buchnera aphidicola]AEH39678.1 glycyl-tRNA synthetase, beta subunit [Buchnera aphidicola (Cinara tujafilina)]